MVDDQRVDLIPFAHAGQARSPKLGAIGDDDRPICSIHHAAFGFHQEHVAVVEPFFVHAGDTQECFLDIDRLEHLIRVRSMRNSGAVVDCPTEDNQVDRIASRKKVRDRERIGHDLKGSPYELFGKLIGRATTVEKNRIVIADELCSLQGDGSFFIPGSVVGIWAMELTYAAYRPGVKDPSVSAPGFSRLLERFEVSANGRFTHIQGILELRDRNEPLLPDKLQHSGPSGHRRIGRGLEIHQIQVEIIQNRRVFRLQSGAFGRHMEETHSFFQKYVISWEVFNRRAVLFCLIGTIYPGFS